MVDRKKRGIQNRVILVGIFERNFKYSYEIGSNEYYENIIRVNKNGKEESISIIAHERVMQYLDFAKGKYAIVEGKAKTRNVHTKANKSEKDVYILAENIQLERMQKSDNAVYIQGEIQYQPVWHKNSSVKRTIIRANKFKNEQIPCNFYGKEAKRICKLPEGTIIKAEGKIEGRNRLKLYKDGRVEVVRIYEVRISNFQVVT